MGEFETPEQLLAAARKTREAGYKHVDAYTPFPIEGLAEAIGFRWTAVPLLTLIGGVGGGLTGFGLAVLVLGHHLSPEYCRPAAEQLARLHPRDVRTDRARSFDLRRGRDAGAQ